MDALTDGRLYHGRCSHSTPFAHVDLYVSRSSSLSAVCGFRSGDRSVCDTRDEDFPLISIPPSAASIAFSPTLDLPASVLCTTSTFSSAVNAPLWSMTTVARNRVIDTGRGGLSALRSTSCRCMACTELLIIEYQYCCAGSPTSRYSTRMSE